MFIFYFFYFYFYFYFFFLFLWDTLRAIIGNNDATQCIGIIGATEVCMWFSRSGLADDDIIISEWQIRSNQLS